MVERVQQGPVLVGTFFIHRAVWLLISQGILCISTGTFS